MNLAAFLEKSSMTQAALAAEVGCTQGRISQLLAGEAPSFALAQKIEAFTDGQVGFRDWPPATDSKQAA